MFKESELDISPTTCVEADLGYQGIANIHENSQIPLKNYKKNPLTKEQKAENKIQSSSRIIVEHVNALIKVFQIFTQKYRNRRKRIGLRMNLICAIINMDRGF